MPPYNICLAIQYAQAHVLHHWPVCYVGGEWRKDNFPLFLDDTLWSRFLTEYGVLRYAPAKGKEWVREQLAGASWDKLLQADGGGVDALTPCLITVNSKGRRSKHHSFLSKIAAFARPEQFIASDRYSRKGVQIVCKHRKEPDNYRQYLCLVRGLLLQGDLARNINDNVAMHRALSGISDLAFKMRVLDHCLMMIGGRKPGPRGYVAD